MATMPQDALGRLLSLGGELQTKPGQPRRKFELDHMRRLMAALGDPQRGFRSLLIAGTNGKGSTAATLAAIMAAGGARVGLYTSPHLERVHERIQISFGGSFEQIEDGVLVQSIEQVEEAAQKLQSSGELPGPPSFFEAVTAIAFLAFAASRVDLAVLEVGMGGRLDATNIVEPLLSVITDISLDHTEWLGDTVSAIAREKAGVLRPGGVLVTLPQHPEANQALGEVAVALGVEGWNAAEFLPGRELAPEAGNTYELALTPEWGFAAGTRLRVASPLQGEHQRRNIALAITAALVLGKRKMFHVEQRSLEKGIRNTRWPGRLEHIASRPGTPALLLDVAHNPAGAWTLRAALASRGTSAPMHLLFGCMADKALGEIAQILFPLFNRVWLTEVPSPRSAARAELEAAAGRVGVHFTSVDSVVAGLAAASAALAGQEDALLVVAGSVVLVGEVRTALGAGKLEMVAR